MARLGDHSRGSSFEYCGKLSNVTAIIQGILIMEPAGRHTGLEQTAPSLVASAVEAIAASTVVRYARTVRVSNERHYGCSR